MKRIGFIGAMWCVVLAMSAHAEMRSIEGVDFDTDLAVHDQSFTLQGVGLLRYRIVFRAYVGALYLGGEYEVDDLWSEDVPMRLELEYFWAIDGDEFGPAAVPYLKDNLTDAAYQRIKDRAEQLSALYQDVEPGDRYALTYIPGRGTELALNGDALGVIEGNDFAVAYFQVWLGESPISTSFRDQLLQRE